MKTKLIIFFLSMLYGSGLLAQSVPYWFFSTAIDNSTGPPPTGLVSPVNIATGDWEASLNGTTFSPAVYVQDFFTPPPFGWGWAPESNAGQNSYGWVSFPFTAVPNDPRNHSNIPGQIDIWYKIEFFLQSNLPLTIDWDIWADDAVLDVSVNGTIMQNYTPNWSIGNLNQSVKFISCTNWNAWGTKSLNTIVVHCRSLGNGGYAGLMVRSNPPGGLNIAAQPAKVCLGQPVTLMASGGTNYQWMHTSNTNPTQIVFPSAPNNLVFTVIDNTVQNYNNCPGIASVTLDLDSTCCPQSSVVPILSQYNLQAGVGGSITGPVIIDQDITISGNGDFTFMNGDFIINTGRKITLMPGVNLVLSQAHLYGCNCLWLGINVKDGANVTSAPSPGGLCSMIEDALWAIDVGNITQTHATPLLDLDGVIFNKNSHGIYIHNSNLPSIPLGIKSCVFTNRDIPTSTMSWPSSGTAPASGNNPAGLRWTNTAATSLSPPYLFNGWPVILPNTCYAYPGLGFGIGIENIDYANGALPPLAPGVSWGTNNPNEFNLFDYLIEGVYAQDASLQTYNNVFQNNISVGIEAYTLGDMNSRLSLSPPMSPNSPVANRFWNNQWGGASAWWGAANPGAIDARNVLEFDITDATFRGYTPWNYSPPPGSPNSTSSGVAINITSNRFDNYSIRTCTFSNQPLDAIQIGFSPGTYDINLPNYGIYGNVLEISDNLFMPMATLSSGFNSSQSLGRAINIGSSGGPWSVPCLNALGNIIGQPTGYIRNNWLTHTENGFEISGMDNFPLGIIDNTIQLWKAGFGIAMYNTNGHKAIRNNYIADLPYNPVPFIGLNCVDNAFPHAITCNTVERAGTGFRFWGNNGCEWKGNIMIDNGVGLHLTGAPFGPTSIGQQGAPGSPSGNQWFNCNVGTLVDAPSNAAANALYYDANPNNAFPGYSFIPTNNQGPQAYNNNPLFGLSPTNGGPYSCSFPSTLIPRPANPTGIITQNTAEKGQIDLYPNPSSGNLSISGLQENEPSTINITDVTGKLVYSKNLQSSDTENINISSLPNGMYLVEIQNGSHKEVKKMVLSK